MKRTLVRIMKFIDEHLHNNYASKNSFDKRDLKEMKQLLKNIVYRH